VSPQGFPSKKIAFHGASPNFAPLFTGQLFFVHRWPAGTCVAETQVKLPTCPGWHARWPMVSRIDKRHGGIDSIRKFIQ
jgi:hypothetical protein